MENKKKVKEATMDFDYIRAINHYMDDTFLNKTLQSLRGGAAPNEKDIVTYKINNTNYLANLYPDPHMRGGKRTMLLHSIFKIPESFSLEKQMAELDLGGARSRSSRSTKDSRRSKQRRDSDNMSGERRSTSQTDKRRNRDSQRDDKRSNSQNDNRKKSSKQKGGTELYDLDYHEVEDLGGNKPELEEEVGGARKKKTGRKSKKNNDY